MLITKITQKLEKKAQANCQIYDLISRYYKPLIKKEIRLANIKKDDKIMCIGGGNCPMSAILLQKYTGAEVTILDCNKQCCICAETLIEQKNLENLRVLCCNGCDAPCEKFDIIHLAMQISPLESTLKNLMARSNSGTKFLVRIPKKSLSNLYSPFRQKLKAVQHVKHHLLTNLGHTLLFEK